MTDSGIGIYDTTCICPRVLAIMMPSDLEFELDLEPRINLSVPHMGIN